MLKNPIVDIWISMETLKMFDGDQELSKTVPESWAVDTVQIVQPDKARVSLDDTSGEKVYGQYPVTGAEILTYAEGSNDKVPSISPLKIKETSNSTQTSIPTSCVTVPIDASRAEGTNCLRSAAIAVGDKGEIAHNACLKLDNTKSMRDDASLLQSIAVKRQIPTDSQKEGSGCPANENVQYSCTADRRTPCVTEVNPKTNEIKPATIDAAPSVSDPQQTIMKVQHSGLKDSDRAHHETGIEESECIVGDEQFEGAPYNPQVDCSKFHEQGKLDHQLPSLLGQDNQDSMCAQSKAAVVPRDGAVCREQGRDKDSLYGDGNSSVQERGQGNLRLSGSSLQEREDGYPRCRRGFPEKRVYKPGIIERSLIDQVQAAGRTGVESRWGDFIREASQIGIMGLSGLLQHIMELVCKDMWPYLVVKEPPWNFPDILKVLQKHWRSLFDGHLPRIVQMQRDELENVLRTAKREGPTAELAIRMTGCLRHLLRVVPIEWKEEDELSDEEENSECRKHKRVTREEAMESLGQSQHQATELCERCSTAVQDATNGQRGRQRGQGEPACRGWGNDTKGDFNHEQRGQTYGRHLNQESRHRDSRWQASGGWDSKHESCGWSGEGNNKDDKNHWAAAKPQTSVKDNRLNRVVDPNWSSQSLTLSEHRNMNSSHAQSGWRSRKHQTNSKWRTQECNEADTVDSWATQKIDQDWDQTSVRPNGEWTIGKGNAPLLLHQFQPGSRGGEFSIKVPVDDGVSVQECVSQQSGAINYQHHAQAPEKDPSVDRGLSRQEVASRKNWAEPPMGRGFQNCHRGGHLQHKSSRQHSREKDIGASLRTESDIEKQLGSKIQQNREGIMTVSEQEKKDPSLLLNSSTTAASQNDIRYAGTHNPSTKSTSWGPHQTINHHLNSPVPATQITSVEPGEGETYGAGSTDDFTIPAENKHQDGYPNNFETQGSGTPVVYEAGKLKSCAQATMPLSAVRNICSEARIEQHRAMSLPPSRWKKNEIVENHEDTLQQCSTAGDAMINYHSNNQQKQECTEEFNQQKASMGRVETVVGQDVKHAQEQDWDWIYRITAACPLEDSGEIGKLIAIRDLVREIAERARHPLNVLTPMQKSALREVAHSFASLREKMKQLLLDDCVGESMVVFQVCMSTFLSQLFDQQTILADQSKAALARFTNECPEELKELLHLWMINGVMDKVLHYFHNVGSVLTQYSQS